MSTVSIVIPCYNDGAFLREALTSAQAQTHPDVEIVVVDDGSTEPATLSLLEHIRSEGVLVVRQENLGLPTARNTGIAATQGEYILPLDADDRLAPEYARLASSIMDTRPEVGIVGGQIEYFGVQSGRDRPTFTGVESMLFQNRLFTSSMTRRTDWTAAGGYPDGLRFGEDWVYWLRILALGRTVHVLDEVVWFYRQRPGQMTRNMRVGDVTQTLVFAMRDQPDLYAAHMEALTDYLEVRLNMLDAFRRRYGRLADAASRVRRLIRSSEPAP